MCLLNGFVSESNVFGENLVPRVLTEPVEMRVGGKRVVRRRGGGGEERRISDGETEF